LTLILAGDHIYKMNYGEMLECHRALPADITIATLQVAPEEAGRYGIAEIDPAHRIVASKRNRSTATPSARVSIPPW